MLVGYATTGLVVDYLLATSDRARRRWMVTAASVQPVGLTLVTLALVRWSAAVASNTAPLSPDPYADANWTDLVGFGSTT